jgi:hypothetical protein
VTPYTASMVARARELAEADWRVGEIVERLEIEYLRPFHHQSVGCWINEAVAEKRRRVQRETKRARYRQRMMLEMRARDLSFRSIAAMSGLLWGEELSAEQVRYRLNKLSAACGSTKP